MQITKEKLVENVNYFLNGLPIQKLAEHALGLVDLGKKRLGYEPFLTEKR
jgi:hypothetical protein